MRTTTVEVKTSNPNVIEKDLERQKQMHLADALVDTKSLKRP
jgi:hypothetical protein